MALLRRPAMLSPMAMLRHQKTLRLVSLCSNPAVLVALDRCVANALANARSLGYDQIEACHFVDNPASGQVLRKLGFRPTGQIIKRFSVARGGDVDAVEFGINLSGADQPESDLMRPLAA